jgi:hypothetical protein
MNGCPFGAYGFKLLALGLTMNTVASSDQRIEHVRVTEDEIIAQLVDGRVISVGVGPEQVGEECRPPHARPGVWRAVTARDMERQTRRRYQQRPTG